MIIGYIYSQKCNENAKLNWVITFWILVTFFSKYKQKNASRDQGIILAKGQLDHSNTFWTMPILMFSLVNIILDTL